MKKNTKDQKYQKVGSKDRDDYLDQMADEYDVPNEIVNCIADIFGPNEDFDGLLCALEDYHYFNRGE